MTIEEQLRALARHADQHQPAITAAEIVQRESGQRPERTSPYTATASSRRLTVAPSTGGAGFEPMEEMHMSGNTANDEHENRWRTPAIAAAAVVVLGVGAIAVAVSNTNADDDGVSQAPAPTTVAPTTVAPTTTAPPVTEIVPGTDPELTVTYTLPDGWEADDSPDGLLLFGSSSVVNFWEVGNVYTDGCDWTLLDPPLGPNVDDLATVWAELPGFTATTPVDITVDGYAGKQVVFTVPDYPTVVDPVTGEDEADCTGGKFGLWTDPHRSVSSPHAWAQTPGQQTRQWILDVDGTRLVINEWSEPGTTSEQLAAMDQFIASIQIG